MATLVAFCQLGTHGLDESKGYPWGRWMNGQQWGYCPEFFGYSPTRFKKTLREAARSAGKSVQYDDHVLNREHWIIFSFND
jgi:hypothetical protein